MLWSKHKALLGKFKIKCFLYPTFQCCQNIKSPEYFEINVKLTHFVSLFPIISNPLNVWVCLSVLDHFVGLPLKGLINIQGFLQEKKSCIL